MPLNRCTFGILTFSGDVSFVDELTVHFLDIGVRIVEHLFSITGSLEIHQAEIW